MQEASSMKCLINMKKDSTSDYEKKVANNLNNKFKLLSNNSRGSDQIRYDNKQFNISKLSLSTCSQISTLESLRSDIRPLQDKLYQLQMIHTIENHLQKIGILPVMDNGKLKSISAKMFVEITNRLLKEIEYEEEMTVKNFVDNTPRLAKMLRYPGHVNKSWLKTVSAIHSWPNVLGWLSWLVAVSKVKEKARELLQIEHFPFFGSTFHEKERMKSILKVILSCKRSHNKGNLTEEQRLIRDYLKGEEVARNSTGETLSIVKTKLVELERKCVLEEVVLNSVNKKNVALKKTLKAIQMEEDDCERFMEMSVQQFTELKNHKVIAESEIAVLQYAIEEKSACINHLEESFAEFERMLTQKERTMELIMENNEAIAELDQIKIELQEEYSALRHEINQINSGLMLAINANRKIFFDEKVDLINYTDPELIDLLTTRENELQKLRDAARDKLEHLQTQVETSKIDTKFLIEEMRKFETIRKERTEYRNECEREIYEVKKEMKKKSEVIMNEIENVKTELDEIKKEMPDLEQVQSELQEAKLKLEALQNSKLQLKDKMKNFFAQLLQVKSQQ